MTDVLLVTTSCSVHDAFFERTLLGSCGHREPGRRLERCRPQPMNMKGNNHVTVAARIQLSHSHAIVVVEISLYGDYRRDRTQ